MSTSSLYSRGMHFQSAFICADQRFGLLEQSNEPGSDPSNNLIAPSKRCAILRDSALFVLGGPGHSAICKNEKWDGVGFPQASPDQGITFTFVGIVVPH